VAERDTLTEKLSLVTEDYITHRNALERAEAALRAIADPREHPCDGVILRAIAVRGLEGGSRELRTRVQAGGPCPFVTRRSPLPALRTLLDKLERVEASEAYRSVWIVAQVHAGPYHGENWAVERAAARAALIDTAPEDRSTAPWDSWRHAEARVRELEALIVAWENFYPGSEVGFESRDAQALRAEAQRIREGEARPRLSTEDEARAAMGDGQALTKLREIKP
jgi:hypothetical protein